MLQLAIAVELQGNGVPAAKLVAGTAFGNRQGWYGMKDDGTGGSGLTSAPCTPSSRGASLPELR